MVVALGQGNLVGVTSFHGIALDHQLIIYSRALATGSIISIVYGVGVHSYRALKYAGKPWIRQSFFANVSKALFRPKHFYRQSFLLYGS